MHVSKCILSATYEIQYVITYMQPICLWMCMWYRRHIRLLATYRLCMFVYARKSEISTSSISEDQFFKHPGMSQTIKSCASHTVSILSPDLHYIYIQRVLRGKIKGDNSIIFFNIKLLCFMTACKQIPYST